MILWPVSDFSPIIQMWYNRIHAYLQLIRLKKGNASNTGNIVRFAKRKHIERPEELTMEKLKYGLQFCQIRKTELRKQARGLRKVHLRLRDCLLDAQSKRQNEHAKAIKQKLHQEENKRMWCLIKRTVKEPHSPSILRVQRIIEGEMKEYTVQENVEQAIQHESEVQFSLAHSALITNSLLGEKLQYLSDKSLASNHNRYLQYSNQLGPCHSNHFAGDRETGDENCQQQQQQNHNTSNWRSESLSLNIN